MNAAFRGALQHFTQAEQTLTHVQIVARLYRSSLRMLNVSPIFSSYYVVRSRNFDFSVVLLVSRIALTEMFSMERQPESGRLSMKIRAHHK